MIVPTFDVVEEEVPGVGRLREHSHIVVDETGKVRSFCVYDAPDIDIVRSHSSRLGPHEIDSIDEIAGEVTPADFPPA